MAPVGGDGPATRAAAVSCSYRRCRVDEGSPTAIERQQRCCGELPGEVLLLSMAHAPQGTAASTTPPLGFVELNEFWVNPEPNDTK